MNKIFAIAGIVVMLTLTGCFRTYTLTQTRTDQDMSGNQGLISQTASDPKTEQPRDTVKKRELTGLDVEFPSVDIDDIKRRRAEKSRLTAEEDSVAGNRGSIYTE